MEDIKALSERVETLIELDALIELGEFINDLNISDVAELINENPPGALIFFKHLDFQRALAVFRIIDSSIQEDLLKTLPPNQIIQILNDLPPDDRTSLLSELPSHAVKEVIKHLNPEERKITLSLLGYPEESVGRLMTPDYIDVEPDWTVEQVLTYIRDYGKSSETIDVIYVTDQQRGDMGLIGSESEQGCLASGCRAKLRSPALFIVAGSNPAAVGVDWAKSPLLKISKRDR